MLYKIAIAQKEDAEEIAKIAKQSCELHQQQEPTFLKNVLLITMPNI